MSKKMVAYWICGGLAVIEAVAISRIWLDIPLVRFFSANLGRFDAVGQNLDSAVLITIELFAMAVLIAARLGLGYLPNWGKAVLVAMVASLLAFAANELILKVFFGVANPTDFLRHEKSHDFYFLAGSQQSSFPSGHMALATSFSVAFVRLYRRVLLPMSAMLVIAGILLVVGEWHFLSDVIAGAFVGGIAGWVASELWMEHNRQQSI